MKHPKDYSVDEVCLFFVSLELGHLVPKIRDNSVDGGLLVSLAESDFMNDLGLSGLQTKRVMRGIEFASDLSGGGEGKGASEEEAAALKEKIAALEKENRELKDEVMNLRAALQPEPPKQQPQYYSQPPPPQQCHHHRPPPGAPVVREAAKGTARGAVLGAVAGAVAGAFFLSSCFPPPKPQERVLSSAPSDMARSLSLSLRVDRQRRRPGQGSVRDATGRAVCGRVCFWTRRELSRQLCFLEGSWSRAAAREKENLLAPRPLFSLFMSFAFLLFFIYRPFLPACLPCLAPRSAMGAAVGATAGGMRGLGERRRARMVGRF
jgi:hypothetical protein